MNGQMLHSIACFFGQGEFVEQAEKARDRAQRSGGVFQEKFEELKKT